MAKVLPGKTVEQVEHWALFRNMQIQGLTDEESDRVLLPLLETVEVSN